MITDEAYTSPISLEDLLQHKALEPISSQSLETLHGIARLDVADFSEAEVRTCIIDPIVRILGYEKGTNFSFDLEKPIRFLGKTRFPDYKLTLWKDNFWLIEAKRPRPNESNFGYEDLRQAIEYAIHPEINAALIVLCDGCKIEVFDREVSVTDPVLHFPLKSLVGDFDKIRILLEPWQVWFFQKRRIARLLDKVFDKEFNLARVEEFKGLVERRLAAKRTAVLENFRRNIKPDNKEHQACLRAASVEGLVDLHLFLTGTIANTHILLDSLVAWCEPNTFQVN